MLTSTPIMPKPSFAPLPNPIHLEKHQLHKPKNRLYGRAVTPQELNSRIHMDWTIDWASLVAFEPDVHRRLLVCPAEHRTAGGHASSK